MDHLLDLKMLREILWGLNPILAYLTLISFISYPSHWYNDNPFDNQCRIHLSEIKNSKTPSITMRRNRILIHKMHFSLILIAPTPQINLLMMVWRVLQTLTSRISANMVVIDTEVRTNLVRVNLLSINRCLYFLKDSLPLKSLTT